jgi:ubiquinone/menaquinone biosynthesis C-methylase UbiE
VPFYDDMHAFKDYAGEAHYLVGVIRRHHPNARSLLDVACGTGRHLEHLRQEFEVEGLDVNPRFLSIARNRLPGVTLHEEDMTEFDLSRTFDVVTVLFGSITLARTVQAMGAVDRGAGTSRRARRPPARRTALGARRTPRGRAEAERRRHA